MIRLMTIGAALVAVGCGHRGAPTCEERVKAMSAHLAAPREPAALARVSEALAHDVANPEALPPEGRGLAVVKPLVSMLAACPPAARVFAGTAELESGRKDDYLREQLPPALLACRCQASPEEVGARVELWFATWR